MTKVISKEACPRCQENGGDTSEDNLANYDDGHSYCFACGYYKGTNGEKEFMEEQFTYEYIPHRGISQEELSFYGIKTKINSSGEPVSVGFRYPNGSMKIKKWDKKEFKTEGEINKAGLFGKDKFAAGSSKFVTITEGEYDAVSLHQVLKSPVVSVQSASCAARDCSLDREWLSSFERIYLAFDNDEPGRAAVRSVAKLFDPLKVFVVKFSNRKDANEYLQAGELDELRRIWWNAKKYQPDNVMSSLEDFKKILEKPPEWGAPYPFPILNSMTYGIRMGEMVLITAMEGVGKTELMHAIEYKLLKETDDAIAAIYLEEPPRRHLQALAGMELQRPCHLPDSGCTPDEVNSAIQEVVRRDDRLHIYSHFGSDDPGVLLDTVRYLVSACGCKYIMFDHISMACSGCLGEDERRALDYLVSRLAMMVAELNFALIYVSHVNDDGLTRGSRWISKAPHIRIDVSRDFKSEDPVKRNTTYLYVNKNRDVGRTGPADVIMFDQYLRKFTPVNDNPKIEELAA